MAIFLACAFKKRWGRKIFIRNKSNDCIIVRAEENNFTVSHLSANYFLRYQLMREEILSKTFLNHNCANQHYLEK